MANTSIRRKAVIPGDGCKKFQENRLKILELSDGDMMLSIETYNYEKQDFDQSGVVHIKSGHRGGKKQALLIPLRKVLDQALELKRVSPLSRIEGWDNIK